jgi:prepilin-type N-terminal cleavage/methylation domain-containing protein
MPAAPPAHRTRHQAGSALAGRHAEGGFTLIELIMVMVIIGVMAVFVLPRALDLTEWRLRAYGDELQVQTMAMQRLALAQRRPVTAVFRPTGVTFSYADGSELLNLPCPADTTPCIVETCSGTFNALNAGRTSTSTSGAATVTLSAGSSLRRYSLEEETGLFRPLP